MQEGHITKVPEMIIDTLILTSEVISASTHTILQNISSSYIEPSINHTTTVEPPKTDSPYYGNLHNADKSPRS